MAKSFSDKKRAAVLKALANRGDKSKREIAEAGGVSYQTLLSWEKADNGAAPAQRKPKAERHVPAQTQKLPSLADMVFTPGVIEGARAEAVDLRARAKAVIENAEADATKLVDLAGRLEAVVKSLSASSEPEDGSDDIRPEDY